MTNHAAEKRKIRMAALTLVCLFVCLAFSRTRADAAETAFLQTCETVANADGTVTLYVVTDGSIQGYDYGVAFSLQEATPVSYGFTDEFYEVSRKQNGTAIAYYFEEGERVSGDDRYIVFGGMANSGAAYSGRMAYVTFALTGAQAHVSVVQESAEYASASEILAQGTSYLLASLVSPTDAALTAAPTAAATEAASTAAPTEAVSTGTAKTDADTSGGADGTAAAGGTDADISGGTDGTETSDAQSSADSHSASGSAQPASAGMSASGAVQNASGSGAGGANQASRAKTGDAADTAAYAALAVLALTQLFLCRYYHQA